MRELEYRTPLQIALDSHKNNLRQSLTAVGTHPVVASVLAGRPRMASDYLGIQLNKTKLFLSPRQKYIVESTPIPRPITEVIDVVNEVDTMRDIEKPYSGNVEALELILGLHKYRESKVITDDRDYMLYEAMLLLDFTETEYDFSALLLEMNWQLMDIEEVKTEELESGNTNYDLVDLFNLNIRAKRNGIQDFVQGYRTTMLNLE